MVASVQIVTDSSAQFIDPRVISQYGITVLPLEMTIRGRVYHEGVDLEPERYFLRAMELPPGELPALTAPNADSIAQVYAALCRDNTNILSIHLSRTFHPMYSVAKTATQTLLGRCDIEVVDSGTTSIGLGILVEEAAKLAQQGMPPNDIVRAVRKLTPRVYSMFYLESLDYLKRGGVMSESQIVLGKMLGVRPFLTIEEGDFSLVGKVKTRGLALDKFVEFVGEFDRIDKVALLHSYPAPTEFLQTLRERLATELHNGQGARNYPTLVYQPSLAHFVGNEAFGIIVYEGPEDPTRPASKVQWQRDFDDED